MKKPIIKLCKQSSDEGPFESCNIHYNEDTKLPDTSRNTYLTLHYKDRDVCFQRTVHNKCGVLYKIVETDFITKNQRTYYVDWVEDLPVSDSLTKKYKREIVGE